MRFFVFSLVYAFCLGELLLARVHVPGVDASTLGDVLKGRVLIEELNCVACHRNPGGRNAVPPNAPSSMSA